MYISDISKRDSVGILIIGLEPFVRAEFPVYPIYDFWSNIEHAQAGLFLTNKGKKRLTTWTIGLGDDGLKNEKVNGRGNEVGEGVGR